MRKGNELQGYSNFSIDLGPVAPIEKADKSGTAQADNGSNPSDPIYNDAPNQKLVGLEGDDAIVTRRLPVWPS